MIAGRFALSCRQGSGLFLFRRRILDVVVLELVIFIDDRQIVVFIVIFEVVIDIVVVIAAIVTLVTATNVRAGWLLGRWTANNTQAPLTLRVNTRQSTREAYLARLSAEGIAASAVAHTPDAVRLHEACGVEAIPGFSSGMVVRVRSNRSPIVRPESNGLTRTKRRVAKPGACAPM